MLIKAEGLKKDFPRAGKSSNFFTAVYPIDLELKAGQMIEITGRSGSGKSTLLNMISGMLTPTEGKVFLDDIDLYSLDEKALSRIRNEKIGLIPQGHTALLSLTVLENVLLPFILYNKEQAPEERAKELLEKVGISSLENARPNELSGGELRRMAIARSMLMRPGVILADEPTAGLDNENTLAVLELFRKAADEGAAILLVTHENEAANYADEVLTMDGGKLVE
ncbi:MAG: ABC transporter ATP-binding protein [Lachnospiraceae bacterium]|nr:ABC transporter ATP-binding protein [Lachnospiraceae bacterium]